MSWQPAADPTGDVQAPAALDTVIVSRTRDLGGFEVRRVLPAIGRRMVGPFIFFDQMGPVTFDAGRGLDVRPHPHIGLATVTYLFEGEILHRDSVGSVQPIRPGDVNWMTAGRGIAHSERTSPETRESAGPVFGIQAWVALPKRHEETEPGFAHHPGASLPVIEGEGVHVRVIAGAVFGKRAPVALLSDMFYADASLASGASVELPVEHEERAIYVADGRIEHDGQMFEQGQLLVLRPRVPVAVRAVGPARVMLLGGEPMDGPRHIWWNFVSSSKDRIEQAKADWKAGRFAPVPDETEFIPLPDDPPPPVRYP
jgi:redox-sensitive bicupin YhaK (pirin superfamily)